GRFSLRSDQAGPYTAFVDLAWLQETLELKGRANLLVSGESPKDPRQWLHSAWTLEDLGLQFSAPESGKVVQLQSERVYLDGPTAAAAAALRPDAVGVLYYLVNSITAESGKKTPYSFVTAVAPSADAALGPVPAGMKDDEILVNRWLADQLGVKEGGRVTLAYSELDPQNEFVVKKRVFTVRAVLAMASLAAEKDLVPQFPGLTDVEGCKDWQIGIPMDEEELKDPANEAYWKDHKMTPKAFVTLAAGKAM